MWTAPPDSPTGVPGAAETALRLGVAPSPGPDPRTLRLRELALLVLATAVTLIALVTVLASRPDAADLGLVPEPAYLAVAYLGLFGAAHLAVWRWLPRADPLLLPCAAVLTGLGLVEIYRLDLAAAAQSRLDGLPAPALAAPRQLAWAALSVVLLVVVVRQVRDVRRLAAVRYLCGLVGIVLLVLPGLLPSSISEVNGSKLWVRIGPLQVQPGEFAKILLLVFVAGLLAGQRELFVVAGRRVGRWRLPRLRDLGPLVTAWVAAMGVVTLEKELGAALLLFGTVLAMIYIATSRPSWVVVGLAGFAGACVLAYMLFPHVRVRVQVWEDPLADSQGVGYQVSQALFGFGTGGMTGTGLGAGHPQLVPLANSDFIIASLGEELGLIGLAAVVVIYLVLIGRGLRAAVAAHDPFTTLLAGGIAFSIGFQLFIVMGGVTALIPETGLTTPFLSYGGSSLLANYVLIGLLLAISDRNARPAPPPERRPSAPLAEALTQVGVRP